MSKETSLKKLVSSDAILYLMEVHDALSAAVATKAGFRALWASGLSISSALGYRDASEIAWTQIVDVVERLADASGLPILVDADGGFGNFNNARLVAKKLWQRGAGGICIEDKIFPKMNSFIGESHVLADIKEFSGRICAIKDATIDSEFFLVARTEALIAKKGFDEAITRALAYAEAGADAILIHSKSSDFQEIKEFANKWQNKLPLFIVPTKYYQTSSEAFRDAKIAAVIWANHNMRVAVKAMREMCVKLCAEKTLANIESTVASLDEIFELLRYSELANAEKKYLP